jgi:hypothetical protein
MIQVLAAHILVMAADLAVLVVEQCLLSAAAAAAALAAILALAVLVVLLMAMLGHPAVAVAVVAVVHRPIILDLVAAAELEFTEQVVTDSLDSLATAALVEAVDLLAVMAVIVMMAVLEAMAAALVVVAAGVFQNMVLGIQVMAEVVQ